MGARQSSQAWWAREVSGLWLAAGSWWTVPENVDLKDATLKLNGMTQINADYADARR